MLIELKGILEAEDDSNWIRGVGAAINSLDNNDLEKACSEAKSICGTMLSGKGGFSDYYVQRVDPHEQAKANQRLDELRVEIWKEIQA